VLRSDVEGEIRQVHATRRTAKFLSKHTSSHMQIRTVKSVESRDS